MWLTRVSNCEPWVWNSCYRLPIFENDLLYDPLYRLYFSMNTSDTSGFKLTYQTSVQSRVKSGNLRVSSKCWWKHNSSRTLHPVSWEIITDFGETLWLLELKDRSRTLFGRVGDYVPVVTTYISTLALCRNWIFWSAKSFSTRLVILCFSIR